MFYAFTSPLYPTTVFCLRLTRGRARRFEAGTNTDRCGRATRPCSCSRSLKDGTRVPFFVTARKGLARDGSNPTMIDCLRRILGELDAGLPSGRPGVAGARRRLGHREPARRCRVRRSVAQGRDAREEAERLRRLDRGRRAPGRASDSRRRRGSDIAAVRMADCWSAR